MTTQPPVMLLPMQSSADAIVGMRDLVVAFDFDQCLSKVVYGDYTLTLMSAVCDFIQRMVGYFGARSIVLVSYSNRISEVYNRDIQPREGDQPLWLFEPKEGSVGFPAGRDNPAGVALLALRMHLMQRCELQDPSVPGMTESGVPGAAVLVDHDFVFSPEQAKNLIADVSGLPKYAHVDNEVMRVKTALSKGHGPAVKLQIAKQIRNRYPTASYLFIDDKWDNLEFHIEGPDADDRSSVFHLHSTKVATVFFRISGANSDSSVASKDKEPILPEYLNKKEWWA